MQHKKEVDKLLKGNMRDLCGDATVQDLDQGGGYTNLRM